MVQTKETVHSQTENPKLGHHHDASVFLSEVQAVNTRQEQKTPFLVKETGGVCVVVPFVVKITLEEFQHNILNGIANEKKVRLLHIRIPDWINDASHPLFKTLQRIAESSNPPTTLAPTIESFQAFLHHILTYESSKDPTIPFELLEILSDPSEISYITKSQPAPQSGKHEHAVQKKDGSEFTIESTDFDHPLKQALVVLALLEQDFHQNKAANKTEDTHTATHFLTYLYQSEIEEKAGGDFENFDYTSKLSHSPIEYLAKEVIELNEESRQLEKEVARQKAEGKIPEMEENLAGNIPRIAADGLLAGALRFDPKKNDFSTPETRKSILTFRKMYNNKPFKVDVSVVPHKHLEKPETQVELKAKANSIHTDLFLQHLSQQRQAYFQSESKDINWSILATVLCRFHSDTVSVKDIEQHIRTFSKIKSKPIEKLSHLEIAITLSLEMVILSNPTGSSLFPQETEILLLSDTLHSYQLYFMNLAMEVVHDARVLHGFIGPDGVFDPCMIHTVPQLNALQASVNASAATPAMPISSPVLAGSLSASSAVAQSVSPLLAVSAQAVHFGSFGGGLLTGLFSYSSSAPKPGSGFVNKLGTRKPVAKIMSKKDEEAEEKRRVEDKPQSKKQKESKSKSRSKSPKKKLTKEKKKEASQARGKLVFAGVNRGLVLSSEEKQRLATVSKKPKISQTGKERSSLIPKPTDSKKPKQEREIGKDRQEYPITLSFPSNEAGSISRRVRVKKVFPAKKKQTRLAKKANTKESATSTQKEAVEVAKTTTAESVSQSVSATLVSKAKQKSAVAAENTQKKSTAYVEKESAREAVARAQADTSNKNHLESHNTRVSQTQADETTVNTTIPDETPATERKSSNALADSDISEEKYPTARYEVSDLKTSQAGKVSTKVKAANMQTNSRAISNGEQETAIGASLSRRRKDIGVYRRRGGGKAAARFVSPNKKKTNQGTAPTPIITGFQSFTQNQQPAIDQKVVQNPKSMSQDPMQAKSLTSLTSSTSQTSPISLTSQNDQKSKRRQLKPLVLNASREYIDTTNPLSLEMDLRHLLRQTMRQSSTFSGSSSVQKPTIIARSTPSSVFPSTPFAA